MVQCFIQSTGLFHSRVGVQALSTLTSHTMILFIYPLNSPLLIIFITGLGPELEELMVEGFLLQVTLPETEQLYRYLLYKLAPLPSHNAPCGNNTEENQESHRGSPHHHKVTTDDILNRTYTKT